MANIRLTKEEIKKSYFGHNHCDDKKTYKKVIFCSHQLLTIIVKMKTLQKSIVKNYQVFTPFLLSTINHDETVREVGANN